MSQKRFLAMALTFIMLFASTGVTVFGASDNARRLTIDMTAKTGALKQGGAGFLYGLGANEVPTTNTLTPIKPKVVVQKAPEGLQHPNGDALRVAEGFIESGGEMVQVYMQDYYGQWAYENTGIDMYEQVVRRQVPLIKEHPYSDNVVYIPFNEPDGIWYNSSLNATFQNDWKRIYDVIHSFYKDESGNYYKDENGNEIKPKIGGPNTASWNTTGMTAFLTFARNNNCMPDVITWHTLGARSEVANTVANYRTLENSLFPVGSEYEKYRDLPIVLNEYATQSDCSVPGKLVQWMGAFEDAKVYACLPFWHLSNNLNDIAADNNEGNGAWWTYKWYGEMSGNSLRITPSNGAGVTSFYGIASLDDDKKLSTILFGGQSGQAVIMLDKIDQSAPFLNATQAHVTVTAANWTAFHGVAYEPEVVVDGVFPIVDGQLRVDMEDMIANSAYNLTVTPTLEPVGTPTVGAWSDLFLASGAEKIGRAANRGKMDGSYATFSATVVTGFRGLGDGVIYNVEVPQAGRYKMDLVYANGVGANISDFPNHNPRMVEQTLSVNGGAAKTMYLQSTLARYMEGMYTEYIDLRAGSNEIMIMATNTPSGITQDQVAHDGIYLTLVGAAGQPQPEFNHIYQAYLGDFNALGSVSESALRTQTTIPGYTGSGYVTELHVNPVSKGGGVRYTVVVEENGLYNIGLRYNSAAAGTAGVYVGNTALTTNRKVKDSPLVNTGNAWMMSTQTVYLQKGINIVDIDATVNIALDYVRIWKAKNVTQNKITVEAETGTIAGFDWKPIYQGRQYSSTTWPDQYTLLGYAENPGPAAKLATNKYASGGQYVTGVRANVRTNPLVQRDPLVVPTLPEGLQQLDDNYLEIKVNVPTAGLYDMATWYSWGDCFSNHSYNGQLIDPYASVQVNDQAPVLYDFRNTFSNEVFKTKTIPVNLNAGQNRIKIFCDNRYIVSWGDLRTGTSTTRRGFILYYENYTPNFDKFDFYPAALGAPAQQDVDEYKVAVTTTAGGTVVADKDMVARGESVSLTITPQVSIENITIGGVSVLSNLTNNGDGTWSYKIQNVQSDLDIRVWFEPFTQIDTSKSLMKNFGFENGDTNGWTVTTNGKAIVSGDDKYEGDYALALSANDSAGGFAATISQKFTGMAAGLYTLQYNIKNTGGTGSSSFNQNLVATFRDGSSTTNTSDRSNNAYAQREIAIINLIENGTLDIAFNATTTAQNAVVILDNFVLKYWGIKDILIDPTIGNGIADINWKAANEQWSNGTPAANAWDKDSSTYYDGQRYSWVGFHTIPSFYLTRVRYIQRGDYLARHRGMTVDATNASTMSNLTTNGTAAMNASSWTNMYTIPSNAATVQAGVWNEIPTLANTNTPYKGFRFASGAASGQYCNVAEMEFYGRVTLAEVPGIDNDLPSSKTVETTAPVTLSIQATGSNLTYKWYKNNVLIAGANEAQYTIANPTVADSGEYYCIVTSTQTGTVASHASQTCVLTVASGIQDATKPVFTKNLSDAINMLVGDPMTLKVAADANGVVTYNWYKDNVDTGVTGDTYTIASFAASDAGVYKVIATNTKADAPNTKIQTSESAHCVATLISAPVVTGIPATLNLKRDQGFYLFTAAATGMGTLTYQWYKNGAAITGATRRTYSLYDIQPVINDATYTLRVTSTIPRVASPLYTEVSCVITVDKNRTDAMVDNSIAYFVDCGDHGPFTLSDDDKLGSFNSITDQVYGADRETGMKWGIWLDKAGMNQADFQIDIPTSLPNSQGVFTRYTWAFEQSGGDTDGIAKNMSCRYAKDQQSGGTSPNTGLPYRYVDYRFELPPGEYEVIVAPRNSWSNASPVQVLLNGEQINPGDTVIPGSTNAVQIKSNYWVKADSAGGTGTLDVDVRTTHSGGTVQLAYIIIKPVKLSARVVDNKIEAAFNDVTALSKDVKLIIALYDQKDSLKAISSVENSTGFVSGSLDISGLNLTNCKYKVFALDKNYVPLTANLTRTF